MAEPSDGERSAPGSASTATAPADRSFPRQLNLGAEPADPHDGPDYVDDWMKKNLAPAIVEFVRNCCTSFVRWDLLRQLHAGRIAMTPADLARAIGANHLTASSELETLASLGLVSRRKRGRRITYQLEPASALGKALDTVVRAYDGNGEFRFALVYAIVRASHQGSVLD